MSPSIGDALRRVLCICKFHTERPTEGEEKGKPHDLQSDPKNFFLKSRIAATPPGARQGFGGPNYPRHPARGSGMGCDRALCWGCSCDTPATPSKTAERAATGGVARPWSATGGGVASAPLSSKRMRQKTPKFLLTCFRASFFPFRPLSWPPLFLPFSRHMFALFSPSKSALFCRAKGTAQSLEGAVLGWTSPQSSGRNRNRSLRFSRSTR